MAENTKEIFAGDDLAAWLVVCVPLAWGVYFTLLNAMKLFAAVPSEPLALIYSSRFSASRASPRPRRVRSAVYTIPRR